MLLFHFIEDLAEAEIIMLGCTKKKSTCVLTNLSVKQLLSVKHFLLKFLLNIQLHSKFSKKKYFKLQLE